MDAIRLLTDDHRSFESLFQRYLAADRPRLREDLAARLLHEIRLHVALEERYVDPLAGRIGGSAHAHEQIKQWLGELAALDVSDRGFEPKLRQLMEEVLSHSAGEEKVVFPALRKAMGRAEIEALGRVIQNAREARLEEPADGLLGRALNHVLASWKAQLGDAVGRACSAALRIS